MASDRNSKALRLRAVEPKDVDLMYSVENDTNAWNVSDTQAPLSREMLRRYAVSYDADPWNSSQLRLIVEDSLLKMPIGIVDLYDMDQRNSRAFVGIYILREWRGKGLALEALRLVADYSYKFLMLQQLAAKVSVDNEAAIKLFEGAGFIKSGILRKWHKAAGKEHDVIVYQHFADLNS